MKAGFIGLGSMGGPMARRLTRAGFQMTAYDISPQTLAAFDEPGTARESDPIAAARHADMLGVCVRTDEQLEALTSDGALFAALGAGGVFLIHSTVAPDLARKLATQAKTVGVDVIDAGISGGGPAAIEGRLSLFVGGEDDAIQRARSWLDALGTVAHLGPVGRGLEGKLLNNLVSVANYGMSAAILDLGDHLGFNRKQLSEALMAGSAQSYALKAVPGLLRPPGTGGLGPEFLHDLLKKDVDLARGLAPATDTDMAALLASCEAMLNRLERAAVATPPASPP